MGSCLPVPIFRIGQQLVAAPGLLPIPSDAEGASEAAYALGVGLAAALQRQGALLAVDQADDVVIQFAIGLGPAIDPALEEDNEDL